MQCISPIHLRGEVNSTFNDQGQVIDKKQNYDRSVPCGKCVFCLSSKRQEWSFRCWLEFKNSKSAYFTTLSYGEESLPIMDNTVNPTKIKRLSRIPEETLNTPLGKDVYAYKPTLWKKDAQNFIKRLRTYQERKGTGDKIKYYLAGEYGTKGERPHYHALLFNVDKNVMSNIMDIWQDNGNPLGRVHVGNVNEKSISYTTKYMLTYYDRDKYQGQEKPFSLKSKGIGLDKFQNRQGFYYDNREQFIEWTGGKTKMPRYFKEKIFNKTEMEVMKWKTNKEVQLEYWKQYSELKRKGIPDPDTYLENNTRFKKEIIEKRINKQK